MLIEFRGSPGAHSMKVPMASWLQQGRVPIPPVFNEMPQMSSLAVLNRVAGIHIAEVGHATRGKSLGPSGDQERVFLGCSHKPSAQGFLRYSHRMPV